MSVFVSDVANMDNGKPVGDMFVSEYRSLGNTNSGNIDAHISLNTIERIIYQVIP